MKKHSLILLFLSFLLVNCQTQSPALVKESVVRPPLQKLEIEKEKFTIATNIEQEIVTKKGSKITIQPNSFVDANGVQIEGNVEIEFREFHSIEDLIRSGIPMYHESNGQSGYLSTAGMCEIKGTANGTEVFIHPERPVFIDLQTEYTGTEEVGFYELNEETGEWTEMGAPTPVQDPKLAEIELELAKINNLTPPSEPRPYSPTEPVINFNTAFRPTWSNMDRTVWRCAEEDLSNNPLSKSEFKNGLYKMLGNKVIDRTRLLIETEFQYDLLVCIYAQVILYNM